ncbi:integrator complex subunit 1-like, partial [Limulus polyphemus]|uniref:Integrator complex subunit 1-like n=1 Tax=Limulus polyphemus TaxID=6850 RepID=A0ABM1BTG2_LIMPO
MSSMKRGPNKPKALYPSGDFIALGSKTSRTLDIGESKSAPKSPLSASGSGVERKRDGSSSGGPSTSLPSKKPKLSGATAFTPIGRVGTQLKKEVGKQGQWDSTAVEVPASELLTKVLEAEDSNDDERAESLLCGAVKQLKSTRTKPEPTLYLSLMYLAKTRPLMFCTDIVMEAFCSLLKRDVSVNYKTTKGNSMWAVLVANILLAAYHDEESWPELFVKVFVEDSLGERVWVDHEDCKGFVDNILMAFKTKIPPKSMMAPELTFKPDACPSPPTISAEDDEASSSSFHLECQENLENIAVVPRFSSCEESVEQFVLDLIRDYLTRRQPTDVSRNMLRLLVSTCGLSEVRLLVAPKLEMWLQNPKLTRPAQDLLLAVCMNCSQHNQNDVEVIGHLIKIRMKTKPVINHFLQCIRELLNQHTENLSTLLKHAIYNELSNSRNPNNMQLISVIFQHSPERAAKVLADVFFDLLTNRDDYLRALRALFREIVRTLRHEVKFLSFCRGLMQERKDQGFLDMDPQIKERMFMSISDLLVLAILQGIGPAVKEASTTLAREEKKDIGVLRTYQMQVAKIQRDAVWWLWIVPKMYKPDRNAFIHCLQKVLFMEPAEHYYNKDNWTPEGDRPMMLRLASEVPILEDTLMRILIIGLSKEHPLNASDTLDLVDQLLKRVGSISIEGYPVLELQIQEIFDLIFNLCAYHHPDNISLPPGYQPPTLAIADLYWRAWIMLLILVAHNPSNF